MALLLAHTALLFAASYGAARRLTRDAIARLLAAVLLFWANIIVTCLLLSGLHHLGSSAWFFRTSLVLGFVIWLLLRRIILEPASAAAPDGNPSPRLLAAFFLTLAPLAYAGVRLAGTYEPNNYDTLVYHLPRAMFYLGQNTLAHFDTGNPRLVYFPFNYNLLQLYGLIYGPPTQVVNFINLASWTVAGLALYRACRLCAIRANFALIATWFALTATQVYAQATATTNDLPTAAGLICTLVFLLRWRLERRTRDALLAGLAAGLTVGAKLTVIFFLPPAGLVLLALAWRFWRRGEIRAFIAGVRAWILPGVTAVVFAAPFALINLSERGEWMTKTYDFTLNRPFSVACVVQTTEAFLTQFFLEPLHRFSYDLQFTAELNTWAQKTLFPHWNNAFAFSQFYLFPPDLNEDHVWFGFAGPFFLLCALLCLLRPRKFPAPVFWFAALGLGWLATYFALNKWSLYNQRYFVPAVLLLTPCVAAVADAATLRPRAARALRVGLIALAVTALWMDGVYLFKNTSRPYAPLWAGTPVPPALPALPSVMVDRLAQQTRINIDSTDGNERVFLLMDLARNQRFTASYKLKSDTYNVFSEWGFVRKVAYSNIEQRSSYTIVSLPLKATAGVEFLGTIGSGQPALDYYGLAPHPELAPATESNHNVLVVLNYGPHDPGRYKYMGAKVAGLNAPDHVLLTLGVDYEDGSHATLATFTTSGTASVPVTHPFRRFTLRATDQATGQEVGGIDIPYVFRDQPPDIETPDTPTQIFSEELIVLEPKTTTIATGLGAAEGPYPQWDLPLIRWAKAPVLRLEIPPTKDLKQLKLSFSLLLHSRDSASIDVLLNGDLVKNYQVQGRHQWIDDSLLLTPKDGTNIIEFRNVEVGKEFDWLDYLERYPDIKEYVVSKKLPLAQGAREHWEAFGKHETRTLNRVRRTEKIAMPEQLYYAFRALHLEGYRKP